MTKRGMALLTAVLMLWVAAIPAFAADVPYPDVSADHWAYEAIASLHNAGLVEGYPDGTFGGERTFTRYEMAMVFNRILQRLDGRMELLAGTGIDVDALMDEFGSELDLINALTVAIANAQRTADTAAERAYRARLAAVEALAQVQEVEHTATMALALAQEGGGSGDDDARTAAQRAQRVAADAEAAALRATAIAESAFTAVKNVEQAAGSARTTGDAEGALDQVERVTDLVMQADRLAYLAQLNAERALELAESVNARFDELVQFGGEVKATYKTSDSSLNVGVELTATAQPTDNLTVVSGVSVTDNVLDGVTDPLDPTVYAKVKTPGLLREVGFNRSATTNQISLTVGLPLAAMDPEVKAAFGHDGAVSYTSVGLALNDIALSDTFALNGEFTRKTWENVADAELSIGIGANLDMLGGHLDAGFVHVFDGDSELNGGLTYPFNEAVDASLRATHNFGDSSFDASAGLGVKF